jgi:zinc/manganese transport system permease protein
VGASGAILAGVNLWYGFVAIGLLAGGGIELMGERHRGRDVETGLVLAFAMGLGALLLYFDTTYTSNANVTMQVLFGSIFVVSPAIAKILIASGLAALALLAVLYRPLLLATVNPDLAQTRGVPVRLVGLLFLLAMGVAVENGALVVGALLSTALLIGPASTAIQWVSRPIGAMGLSALIGTIATWLGIVLAYDSYTWPPVGKGWPVSFFIPVLIMLFYLAARSTHARRERVRRTVAMRAEGVS